MGLELTTPDQEHATLTHKASGAPLFAYFNDKVLSM